MFSAETIAEVQASMFNTNLASAILGGCVTAFSVSATILWEKSKNEKAEKTEIEAICGALKTELECVLKQYQAVRSRLNEIEENEPYGQNYRIDEDYFSVYHGNTSVLGKLPDPVRSDIVIAYTRIKSLVDTFRENNHMLNSYNHFVLENMKFTILNENNEHLRKHVAEVIGHYQTNMRDMGSSLKLSSNEACDSAEKAISSLKKYLSH